LTPEKLSVALWFSATLAEEVGKTDGNNIKQYGSQIIPSDIVLIWTAISFMID